MKQQYKGKYFIAFYDKNDERLLYIFDNVREILKFQKKPITRTNINLTNVNIVRALKRNSHSTSFLTGELMYIYIFDINED